MVDQPTHLNDLYAWCALVLGFGGFTLGIEFATMGIRRLVFSEIADATILWRNPITPRWQKRNRTILGIVLVVFFGVCIYVLKWYAGVALFLLIALGVLTIARLMMMPIPARRVLRLIVRDLERQHADFQAAEDELTAWILAEIEKLGHSKSPTDEAKPS